MGIDNRRPLPPYITILIQVTAAKMKGRCRFTASDVEDLEQAITAELLRRRARFNPAAGAQETTFLARLVRHAAADIMAARKASNRDYRREGGTLNQWVWNHREKEWERPGDTATEEAAELRLGRPGLSAEEHRDLAIDLMAVAAALPPRLREVLEHYKTLGSAHQVARVMGLHHSSVCDILKQIRQRFEEAGLDAYLDEHPSDPTDSGDRW
jgi:RNA polymerase sigma factor (sigma-70 family)